VSGTIMDLIDSDSDVDYAILSSAESNHRQPRQVKNVFVNKSEMKYC